MPPDDEEKLDPDAWSRRFTLLSDPTRLRLIVGMHHRPDSTVNDLAQLAGISPNTASQSLRALRDEGWIDGDKSGREVRYRLRPDAIVHRILHEIMGDHHAQPTHSHGR
ncbi:hypothetical protein GCM10027169_20340 [Gordonia jinhuaensis]|uniref:HTH arsR-type domain-containing protein n=1 Tax=Gordonia jinhuaensis TaxID=1517702 RepID=A0A916TGQ6_9ACTN|nr:hypothetical protein GCM10011489_34400 [Gordonia jinhuaensis]